MRTNIEISPATPKPLGYKDSVSKLNSYQLRGVDQMVDEIYYQLPTSEHLLEMQNILKIYRLRRKDRLSHKREGLRRTSGITKSNQRL